MTDPKREDKNVVFDFLSVINIFTINIVPRGITTMNCLRKLEQIN